MLGSGTPILSFSELRSPLIPSPQPTPNMNLPPHIQAQMEEFRTGIFDKIQNFGCWETHNI